MADITTVVVVPWPLFTGIVNGQPAIGAKLWSYEPETSIPKSTFADPFYITPNPNPLILNDQGQHLAYLQGFYKLRFTDSTDVVYWEVDSYAWPSGGDPVPPGQIITGSTDATVSASPGADVLTVPGLVPTGYRCLGTTYTITTTFGTSGGLAALALGDHAAMDRWGIISTLDAGTTGGQISFHAGDEPVADLPYVLYVSALGGTFDGAGAIHLTAYWQALPADVP